MSVLTQGALAGKDSKIRLALQLTRTLESDTAMDVLSLENESTEALMNTLEDLKSRLADIRGYNIIDVDVEEIEESDERDDK